METNVTTTKKSQHDAKLPVSVWRSCLSDPPNVGETVEILHDNGNGKKEIINHKWDGWENIQWVMYCCKGWRYSCH